MFDRGRAGEHRDGGLVEHVGPGGMDGVHSNTSSA
jgi:hypothetical protein